ncbi:MAG: MFS transporter [Candidatus Omnitrophota bacterium]
MLAALKIRDFRLYWFGMTIVLIGDWIQVIALGWLIYKLTNSAFLLGLIDFIGAVPMFSLTLFGGVLADRIDRKKIIIVTQAFFMLLAFTLGVLTQANLITPFYVGLIAFLSSIVRAFDLPCRQAFIRELVDKERLFNAITLNSISFQSSQVIGPALAGIIASSLGISSCFYANAVSSLAIIISLFFVRRKKVIDISCNAGKTVWQGLKEGLNILRESRLILMLLVTVAVVTFFSSGYGTFMPIFAKSILKVDVKGLGMLMSSAGFGALIGGFILIQMGDFKAKGRLLMFAAFIFASSVVAFSLSKIFAFSLLALVFIGASRFTSAALVNTLLQLNVTEEFRGRVMSLFVIILSVFAPLGSLVIGGLSKYIGISFTIMLGGSICITYLLFLNLFYPGIRRA